MFAQQSAIPREKVPMKGQWAASASAVMKHKESRHRAEGAERGEWWSNQPKGHLPQPFPDWRMLSLPRYSLIFRRSQFQLLLQASQTPWHSISNCISLGERQTKKLVFSQALLKIESKQMSLLTCTALETAVRCTDTDRCLRLASVLDQDYNSLTISPTFSA